MAEDQPGAVRSTAVTLDLAGYITDWNEAASALFGYSAQEALGQHLLFLCAPIHEGPDFGALTTLPPDTDSVTFEVHRLNKSGDVVVTDLSLHRIRDTSGAAIGLRAAYAPTHLELSPDEKMRLYVRIIEDSNQAVLVTDARERIVMVNRAFTRITGYSTQEAQGQTPDLLRSGPNDAQLRTQIRAAMRASVMWFGEIIGRRKNGELFPQSVSISPIHNEHGVLTHVFSLFSDAGHYRETEARLHQLVNFDSVTALPNRLLLTQLLEQSLSFARRNQAQGALLVIQLQRLGWIYDTLGHPIGDAFLAEIGSRLREALREQDLLGRIGHDKLLVGLLPIPKQEHAGLVAQKLLVAVHEVVAVGGHEILCPATIGIALYPDNGATTEDLLRKAELASHRARKQGESLPLFFSDDMNQRATERFRIESELRRALIQGELLFHHQPKVSLRSGHIVGSEALIRWQHPSRGLTSPSEFISVAEETSLILDLGEWVLNEACRQIRSWADQGLTMPPLAINLSARQFDQHLPRKIDAILSHHGVLPSHLKLEITETLVVRGADQVIPIMNELVAMGLGIALDDFGTGYSSLAYLKRFPITTLKIDRSFVTGIPLELNDCAIAQAIVTMGQQLRHEIVAEGVETREQMKFLRDLGCDQLQGYLFSPPVPVAEYEQQVRNQRRLRL